jgi:hypothetical protein
MLLTLPLAVLLAAVKYSIIASYIKVFESETCLLCYLISRKNIFTYRGLVEKRLEFHLRSSHVGGSTSIAIHKIARRRF